MSKNELRYCAIGDYGMENHFPTEEQCKEWIAEQIAESKREDASNPLPDNYYFIRTYTQAEIDAMPEN